MTATNLPITRGEQRYEGKAKRVYATSQPALFIVEYKDDATAFNAQKRGTIAAKGIVNNRISAYLYGLLLSENIPTHFVQLLSQREQLVQAVEIVPVEVIVRNLAAGSFAKRLGIAEGTALATPVVEYCAKSDALGDPLVSEDTPIALGWASASELATIRTLALRVNSWFTAFLLARKVTLVDFKLEFGRLSDGTIVLADEISPDTCRFWDSESGEKLDKDRFRRDLGNVEAAYLEMFYRITGEHLVIEQTGEHLVIEEQT
jgi:phosphoribosylaminoimidazole-succinocarboxamide synthase